MFNCTLSIVYWKIKKSVDAMNGIAKAYKYVDPFCTASRLYHTRLQAF